jgi:hypothetical protein
MQMQDGGAGLRRRNRLLGDLIGRDRQRVRHGRRVNRAGDGAGDDDLVVGFRSHVSLTPGPSSPAQAGDPVTHSA